VLTNHSLDDFHDELTAQRWSIVDLDTERAIKGDSILNLVADPPPLNPEPNHVELEVQAPQMNITDFRRK
jgi:hypothetical protein